jgi:GAF domain-containing protein
MMPRFLDVIFDTSRYQGKVAGFRARVIYAVVLFVVAVSSIHAVLAPVEVSTLPLVGMILFAVYPVAAAVYLFNRRAQVEAARWGAFALWYIGGVLLIVSGEGGSLAAAGGAAVLLIMLGGLLLGRDGIGAGLGASMVTLALRAVLMDMPDGVIMELTVFHIAVQIIAGGLLVYAFLHYARVSTDESVVNATEERQLTAEVLAQVAQHVAERNPLAELLSQVVQRINDGFDMVYHTQIFLVDEAGQRAELVASTGEAGRKLLQKQHRLGVGSHSVIGQVTLLGTPIVAHADKTRGIHRRNELLPETVVEAAFPFRLGGKVIGALDVQSKQRDAFNSESTIASFQALADSVTLAIDNSSQFEAAERRLQENERLVEEAHAALREVERLNERLTGRAWAEYLRGAVKPFALEVDFEHNTTRTVVEWTAALQDAIRNNHFTQEQYDDHQIIAVPLQVRGRVIGVMEFELSKDQNFDPDDLNLIREVGEHFGMAVENARLVDESRRVAQREALVNQITSRLQMTNDVEAMLDEAARGLRDAFKANKVAIRLGPPPRNSG